MNDQDIGRVFLLCLPWDWTIVGRLRGFVGGRLILADAGYFTRTGATFNRLCKEGFVAETQFHLCGEMRVPNEGLVFPWMAGWPQPVRRNR